MRLTRSGLDIELEERTGELRFGQGVLCDGGGDKRLGAMRGLFATLEGCDLELRTYWAYRNIRRAGDEDLWLPKGARYDITVLLPGAANGEFFKTSGHYHGFSEGRALPYGEVYEVLCGEVAFVLQRSPQLSTKGDGAEPVDAVRVLHVRAGETIVIPPLWGHASINVADVPSAFSNVAVADTPLLYGPVAERSGMAVRIVSDGDVFDVVRNECWEDVGPVAVLPAHEAPELGIVSGRPLYESYVEEPRRFSYLFDGANQLGRMEALLEA